jgi:hypothetical protein
MKKNPSILKFRSVKGKYPLDKKAAIKYLLIVGAICSLYFIARYFYGHPATSQEARYSKIHI